MRARAPFLPVAGLGIDDMYSVVGREHWIGRRVLRSARYDLPIAYGAFGRLSPKSHTAKLMIRKNRNGVATAALI